MRICRISLYYGWPNCFRSRPLPLPLIWTRHKIAPWQVVGAR